MTAFQTESSLKKERFTPIVLEKNAYLRPGGQLMLKANLKSTQIKKS